MSPSLDRKQVEVIESTRMVTNVTKPTITIYPPAKDITIYPPAKEKDEIAPGLRVPARTPPIFFAHGGDDIISSPEHSVFMYLALKRAGIPAELHIYASAAHDFGVRASDHPYSTWTASCVEWLRYQESLQPRKQR